MSIQFDDYRRLVENCIKRGIIKPAAKGDGYQDLLRQRAKEAMRKQRERRKAEAERILAYGQQ